MTISEKQAIVERLLARLTSAEERAWQFYFHYFKVDTKWGDDRAGQATWRNLLKEFPRLRKYLGAKA